MRVLLTGATGFLGSHIAAHLVVRGDDVLAIHRPGTRLDRLQKVIGNHLATAKMSEGYDNLEDILAHFKPDAVIHVAAKSRGGESPSELKEYVDANILFPSRLLQAMEAVNVRALVNAGTSWQWGEDGSYRPFNYYAATKQCFEDILPHYCESGLKCATLRLFDIVGPGDDRNRIIDLLIDAGLRGEALKMSPGEQHMYIVDVRDAARAFVHAVDLVTSAEADAHSVYGLRSHEAINLKDLVDQLQQETGLRIDVEFGGRPYRAREIMRPYDGQPLPPGWQPQITLPQTLRDMVHFRQQALLSA
ncbi:NAD-dependent epimerase/dehydratase family protein [Sphingobium fluviale]|nr:NAD(P)-dependent oxidoreductase [Sphingobium fluviale]